MLSEKLYLTLKVSIFLILLPVSSPFSQIKSAPIKSPSIDVSGFYDCAHHWYDITDHEGIISPEPGQKKYKKTAVRKIAENILLFQKNNGGWPKNYDMLAALTSKQKEIILQSKNDFSVTTFDNDATHSHVEYLAKAYAVIKDKKYKEACLNGIEFILNAQYPNGGWPQFYPDSTGYRKYITFNDNAMTSIMITLYRIMQNDPVYFFMDNSLKKRVRDAFDKGIQCILKCQIVENGKMSVWCQQHDNIEMQENLNQRLSAMVKVLTSFFC